MPGLVNRPPQPPIINGVAEDEVGMEGYHVVAYVGAEGATDSVVDVDGVQWCHQDPMMNCTVQLSRVSAANPMTPSMTSTISASMNLLISHHQLLVNDASLC